jgi:hypothetical protein
MFRLSHFAAPAIVGAALILGSGCASEDRHPADVPLNAQEIGVGREKVTYQAPHDGTVYVYDDTAHRIIYSGKVDRGQTVQLDAKKNQVLVDNQIATREDLINDHKYRVFFDRSEQDRAQTSGQTIQIQPGQSTAPQTTITTPGASVTTPNNTTVTVPPPNSNNTTVTVPPPSDSGSQTTVTTPSGTVVKERSQP